MEIKTMMRGTPAGTHGIKRTWASAAEDTEEPEPPPTDGGEAGWCRGPLSRGLRVPVGHSKTTSGAHPAEVRIHLHTETWVLPLGGGEPAFI